MARRSPSARAAYAVDRRPYENSYARFMKLYEGKVIDGTAFYESISFNDLWTESNPGVDEIRASPRRHSLLRRSA